MKNDFLLYIIFFVAQFTVGQDIFVTQNLDASSITNQGVRCRIGGVYQHNYFARAFDLQNDYGIDAYFELNEIEIGVRLGKNITVDVNIYTSNTTDLSSTSLSLTGPIETQQIVFGENTVPNLPFNVNAIRTVTFQNVIIPAGEILVVEVFAPFSGSSTDIDFAIGTNTLGQTKPSYFKSPDNCDINNFVEATALSSFPLNQNFIINVRGKAPESYALTTQFKDDFNTEYQFENTSAGPLYKHASVQADSDDNEFIIEWTSSAGVIHKWYNTNSPLNEEFILSHDESNPVNSEISNSFSIIDNKYYTFQIRGLAYADRNAVIMETSNPPVEIQSVDFLPYIFLNNNLDVTVQLSTNKSPEERAFIRYSNDGFTTHDELDEFNFLTNTSSVGTFTFPQSMHTVEGQIAFYVFTTSLDANTATDLDLITLYKDNNFGANYVYEFGSAYITTTGATDWNVESSWLENDVPPPGADVIIAHDLNLTDNTEVPNIEIRENISLTIQEDISLSISNNGSITSTGDGGEITGNGVVRFVKDGSIPNKISISNVILEGGGEDGGVSFGTQCTITGSLTLNSGSFVATDSPIYGENSTLIYNTGSYGRNSEWSNTNDTQSNPANVVIRSGTELNMGANNTADPATITGDLTIESGGSLYMDFSSNDMEAPLVVGGDFINDGTISLSDLPSGDLKVLGNFTNNATFNFKNRALFFEGSLIQELNAASELSIPYLLVNKSAGEVVLYQDIVINGNSGTALNMSNQGILNLNGHQLQIGDNTITYVKFLDNAALKGSTDSKILFKSTNTNSGNLRFLNSGFGNFLSEFEMDGNGAISLSDTLNILRRFVLKNGTFNSNGNLTFKSSDSLTAIIPEVTDVAGVSINGDIRVERHYPMGNRAFRYVSSPVTSAATIHAQWQEGVNNADTSNSNNQNPNPGFGTHITGSQTGANGFDATQTGNPSLFTWDNSVVSPAWTPIPNTDNTTLEAGKAYALMMRGDRSTNLNSNSATGNSTVLRSWGEPIIGEHTASTSINDTLFALIGNPYQAQVDLTKVEKSGFGNFFYIWDPTIPNRGGYAAVQIDGNGYVNTTPSTGTAANQFLQVGQAFFIQATADNPSMTFQESHKSDATDNLSTFSMPNYANINVNLYRNGNQIVDGLRISLAEDFDDEVNFEDAVKLWNEQEYIAIDKNQSWLMVEKRSIPENDTIRLFTGNYVASDYQLKIDVQQLENHEVYLHDAYLNESQLLNNNEQHTYSFSVDASLPESVHPSRFSLFFNPMPLSTDIALQNNRIACYPNPVTEGTLNVLWPLSANSDNTTLIEVYDVLGRVVFNQKTNANSDTVSINISTLSSGIYVLKATRKEQHFTTKISVERN